MWSGFIEGLNLREPFFLKRCFRGLESVRSLEPNVIPPFAKCSCQVAWYKQTCVLFYVFAKCKRENWELFHRYCANALITRSPAKVFGACVPCMYALLLLFKLVCVCWWEVSQLPVEVIIPWSFHSQFTHTRTRTAERISQVQPLPSKVNLSWLDDPGA